MRAPHYRIAAALVAATALGACARGMQLAPGTGVISVEEARTAPAAGGMGAAMYDHTAADVHFMSGMIAHHAQAVVMAGWAVSHGASDAIRRLCERIVVGQNDEIVLMQTWLRDRREPVPSATATRMRMVMNGMEHDMLMPGMLSDEQMAQLDKARGVDFDRLFLHGMIGHHEGAIIMVDELFNSPGAGQEEIVFRFASDVYADQTTEIGFMQKMLAALPGGGDRSP
ncbi:MAG: DUF305 domain-containing protein [Gemmatimonadetes bacterium]|nr:DUF305 domain-containing protein [Gemmatimonadota bacterium]